MFVGKTTQLRILKYSNLNIAIDIIGYVGQPVPFVVLG